MLRKQDDIGPMLLPPILTEPFPTNLSHPATSDFLHLLRYSLENWGLQVALKTRNRLVLRFTDIQMGVAIGHQRSDVASRRHVLYISEKPFILVYDPRRRLVVRILHEARDFPRLLR